MNENINLYIDPKLRGAEINWQIVELSNLDQEYLTQIDTLCCMPIEINGQKA